MSLAGTSRYTQEPVSGSDVDTEFEHSDADLDGSIDDEHPDAPRVAQWVGEDDFELSSEGSSADEVQSERSNATFTALKQDLSKTPLGTLAKAQKVFKTVLQEPESDTHDESSSDKESNIFTQGQKRGENSFSSIKGKRPIEHRSNKHAPMEISSKKPVPRRRQVVEIHAAGSRDPRFSDLSGKLSTDRFRTQYSFLRELHADELSTLKQSLARARKLLISSPRDLREEREEEVQRLELAVRRSESTVNREKQEDAERQALGKVYQEEREKRKAGKKGWWLKDADRKNIRIRARMDAIAASGGKRAVKKAIEKRQRKIGQKEKRSRPFAPPSHEKRGDGTGEVRKRRRVE